MKKIKYLLIIITILTFGFKINAKANEVDYSIKGFYIDAKVDVAGSMDVSELIIMKGSFNGYEREVKIKGSTDKWYPEHIDFAGSPIYDGYSIENVSIAAKKIHSYKDASLDMIKDDDFEEFKKVGYASNGTYNKYIETETSTGATYRMYYPSDGETIAFLIKYTVSNVVVVHNDVNELYWNFIGAGFRDDMQNLAIRVILPNDDLSDKFRFWAHGDLTGEINSVVDKNGDNIGVLATIPKVKKGHPIDIRMLFNHDVLLVTDFLDHSEEDATDKILKVEKQRADEANRQRKLAKAVNNAVFVFDIVYVGGLVALIIFLYYKYDKEYKAIFNQEYYRDFLDNYEPEELSYLLNHTVDDNSFSASFMNLIYKHNIEIVNQIVDKNDYVFKIVNRDNLSDSELKLVDILFDKVGNGEIFTFAELKKYTKKQSTAVTFSSAYNSWKLKVHNKVSKNKVYEPFAPVRIIAILVAVIGAILMTMSLIFEVQILFGVINVIISVFFIIYAVAFTKRTTSGNEDYHKAKAIKKFLLDFGTFDEKDLPEIKLWDKYMIYATAFGIADKVEKSMTKYLKKMNIDQSNVSSFGANNFVFINSSINNNISNGISSSISNAISSSIASSVASSSSGGGGGFSSGGGCGGGGGGGGGF